MSSVEALSMGLCCVTELVPEYKQFIPDHPFVDVTDQTLKKMLEKLLDNRQKIIDYKKRAHAWVVKYHSLNSVSNALYNYYKQKLTTKFIN